MTNAARLIEIFHEAKSRPGGSEREQFLSEACHGDPELREQIVSLLQAHEKAGDFLLDPGSTSQVMEKPGDIIGRYELREKLGEGGCGAVYVAQQQEPVRRRVALKVIKLGMDTRQVVARFEGERQVLAMMDHPNIAKVFDAGTTRTGRPYFVMELVPGVRITDFCDNHSLSTRERLGLFIEVCHAIQHAHQKGIIHRDIKPSNILVTVHDGVSSPKVIDFGIAKATEGRLGDAAVYTQFHQFVGTPAYMSPEQATMGGMDIDTRSDIYGLGVLLYELLTGQTPFDGQQLLAAGADAMRQTILEKEPPRPSTRLVQLQSPRQGMPLGMRLSPVASDLDWIVMKCLEKNRSRRYDTATGLGADIKRHLNNEPIVARPPSTAYKLQKAWRRNKLAITTMAAVAIALLTGTGVSVWQMLEASKARFAAQNERDKAISAKRAEQEARLQADAQRRVVQHLLYMANMNLAGSAWEQENFKLLQQSLQDTRDFPDRGFEWYYWQRQAHLHLTTLRGHIAHVRSVAFSPDGRRIVTGSNDNTGRVCDMTSGQELFKLLGHEASVNSVAFSEDGRWIVSGSLDRTVRVWEAASGREVFHLIGHTDAVNSVAFSRDGHRIVSGSSDQTAKVWDVATRQVLATLKGHTHRVNSAAFSPDGQRVVTGSNDRTARVWDAAGGSELHKLIGHDKEVFAVAFFPDGQRILTGGIDPIARVWDAASAQELPLRFVGRGTMTSLSFSSDGQRLVTGSWTSIASVWDAATGREELTIRGHNQGVLCVAISPDGQRIVTGSGEGEVKVWEASNARQPVTLRGNVLNVLAVAFSPDDRRILTATGDPEVIGAVTGGGRHAVQLWNSMTGEKVLALSGHTSGVSSVAFSQDGQRIVTGSGDLTARVWEAATGGELLKLIGPSPINSVAISPDARRIVTGSHDGIARLWETDTGRELFQLVGHTGPILSVAFSPDGRWIVTGGFHRTVHLWETGTGENVRTMNSPMERILSVAFSPDGQRIIAGGWNSMAMVWDLVIDREPLSLIGHNGPVSAASFSPDGRRIVTGSFDRSAKLWDAATGRQLLTLRHDREVSSVAFSRDGQRIVTGSWDRTAKVWEAAHPSQVAIWDEEDRVSNEARPRWERELEKLQSEQAVAEKP